MIFLFLGLVAKGLCDRCGYLYNMCGHSQDSREEAEEKDHVGKRVGGLFC